MSDARRPKGQKDPEKTREQLMTAASQLFAQHGFDGVSSDEIAQAAGVNKAMINYHFGGKEALYEAILGEVLGRATQILSELRDAPLPADEKLGLFVEGYSRLAGERPALPAMMLREVMSGGRFVGPRLLPAFIGVFACVRAVVEQGIAEGTFRPVNPLLTHLTIVGSLTFYFSTAPFRERMVAEGRLPVAAPSTQEFIDHMKALLKSGLSSTGRGGQEPRVTHA